MKSLKTERGRPPAAPFTQRSGPFYFFRALWISRSSKTYL